MKWLSKLLDQWHLKEELKQAKSSFEVAQRNNDLAKMSELQYGIIPQLEEKIQAYESKEVEDILPNFKEDNKDINVSMFDYSKENNNLYLTSLINSIIDSNYYNNLKSLKVYRDKFDGSLTDKKFLPAVPDYKINIDEANHPLLGITFHILKTEEKNKFGFQIYLINKQSSLSDKLSSGAPGSLPKHGK